MVDKFLEMAKQERDRLRAELEKSNIYLRLKWVEDFIAANDKSAPQTAITNGAHNEPLYKSKRERIEAYSREAVKLNDNKATMQKILKHLENRGIKMTPKALSFYLSTGKDRMNSTYDPQTKEWSVK